MVFVCGGEFVEGRLEDGRKRKEETEKEQTKNVVEKTVRGMSKRRKKISG